MPEYSAAALRSKLPKVGTSIFAVMSALAQKHQAINLSQGFPDFEMPEKLISLTHQYMKKGMNQYAPMPGVPALREAISEKMQDLYSMYYNPDTEITVTAGATQALYAAISCIIKPGDEVIVFEPAYDSYGPTITLNGGIPVYIELKQPDFHIDWNEVKKRINQKTRLIMINTPHNPSGSILTAKDMGQLEKIIQNTDILILSDEVYEHIIFDGYEHQSIARYPLLTERSFIVNSFGKTYHNTGWKLGYCAAPEKLMAEFRKVHQFMVFSANTPIQHAVAEYLKDKDAYMSLAAFYQEKRDTFLKLMKGSKFKMKSCLGSYFQIASFKGISEEKDTAFVSRITQEYGVATIPTSAFYNQATDHKLIRFCFAKGQDTLERAAEKLHKII